MPDDTKKTLLSHAEFSHDEEYTVKAAVAYMNSRPQNYPGWFPEGGGQLTIKRFVEISAVTNAEALLEEMESADNKPPDQTN